MNKLLISALFALFSCSTEVKDSLTAKTLHSDKREINISYNGQKLPYIINSENINFPYNENNNRVGISTGVDSIEFMLAPGEKVNIDFIVSKTDTFHTVIVGRSKPVTFNTAYIEENRGAYKVFCPEVHELVNIAVALTNIGKEDDNMVFKGTDYYKEVMRNFERYTNHPLMDSLNQRITEVFGEETYDFYYNIRMNACMYSFDKDNRIVNESPYHTTGFHGDNYLEPLIPLFEDFSDQSKFRSFYASNAAYYDSLVRSYYELVPVKTMWEWIEQRFPQKYDAYKVYFSPLIGGAHSTQRFSDNDFAETVMFINAPVLDQNLSLKENEASLSRIVFTEIDHNYVNPTTDKYPQINALLDPLECWNSGAQGYPSGNATFNEYMTWAVFTLYLYDNFDQEVFSKSNKTESTFMAGKRGFHKFREFNDFVLRWYIENPGKSLETIYPEVITWIKEQPCESLSATQAPAEGEE